MACCMPKLVTRPPKYTLHKAFGQAIVKINGKVHYLGPWESAESKVRYQEAVSRWGAQQVRAANAPHARRGPATHGRHDGRGTSDRLPGTREDLVHEER